MGEPWGRVQVEAASLSSGAWLIKHLEGIVETATTWKAGTETDA
jgi:hypothetical protein